MIRSKLFWTGAVLLAIIPLLLLDIPKHYVDWERDVHDEMITVAQNSYNYTVQQKASILDQVLQSNKELMALMYVKGFAAFLLLCFGGRYLYLYFKTDKSARGKAIAICCMLMLLTSGLKLFSWTTFSGNNKIVLLQLSPADTSLSNIYNEHFKGKVVYVDFWGTTCGPCLEEFRNFTQPLKAHYKNQPGLAYLYICGGTRLIWKQQLQKFDIEGSHIFLDGKEYAALYHQAVRGSKDTIVTMPRYLIVDKSGAIVDKDAPRPSEKDSVVTSLNKYLK